MRAVFASVLVLGTALVLIFGTVLALPKYNAPATYDLAVVTEPGHDYAIRVIGFEAKDFAVTQDGRVTIDVPQLPRSCSWVCLGVTLRDGSPYKGKAIHVLRDGEIVRRLSLRQLERLRSNESGLRRIEL